MVRFSHLCAELNKPAWWHFQTASTESWILLTWFQNHIGNWIVPCKIELIQYILVLPSSVHLRCVNTCSFTHVPWPWKYQSAPAHCKIANPLLVTADLQKSVAAELPNYFQVTLSVPFKYNFPKCESNDRHPDVWWNGLVHYSGQHRTAILIPERGVVSIGQTCVMLKPVLQD